MSDGGKSHSSLGGVVAEGCELKETKTCRTDERPDVVLERITMTIYLTSMFLWL